MFLQLRVVRIRPLVGFLAMQSWNLRDTRSEFMPYPPSILGFEASLRELRKWSSDTVKSTARISLPFEVQAQVVGKENISFKEFATTKIIYIELRAVAVIGETPKKVVR